MKKILRFTRIVNTIRTRFFMKALKMRFPKKEIIKSTPELFEIMLDDTPEKINSIFDKVDASKLNQGGIAVTLHDP